MGILNELSTFKFYEVGKLLSERELKKHVLNLLILLKELQEEVKKRKNLFDNKIHFRLTGKIIISIKEIENMNIGVYLPKVTESDTIKSLVRTSELLSELFIIINKYQKGYQKGNENMEILHEKISQHWNTIIEIIKKYSKIRYEGTSKTYNAIEEEDEIAGIKVIKAA